MFGPEVVAIKKIEIRLIFSGFEQCTGMPMSESGNIEEMAGGMPFIRVVLAISMFLLC